MACNYARVVVDLPHPSLDKPFDYIIPDELLNKVFVGIRLKVPFGIKNKLIDGYCISISKDTECLPQKLKSIDSVYDDEIVFLEKYLQLVEWMRHEYHCTYIEAIRCFVPPYAKKIKKSLTEQIITLSAREDTVSTFISSNQKRAPVMCKVLMLLMDRISMTKDDIVLETWATAQTFSSLKQRGFITITEQEIYREVEPEISPSAKDVILTYQQQHCVDVAKEQYSRADKKPILIRGVTGSGKTQVYMSITEHLLSLGKSVIVLIPEISLTPQTVARFRGKFGNTVAILNSRLSNGERFDEWRRIKNGEARVVIGARSAVFAPCVELGAILIDEEHEDSYKSESSPRYNAIDIAALRCSQENALLVMGSATPDVTHYYKAEKGEYIKLVMDNRIGTGFPDVTVCDMRKEIEQGNRTMFSKPMYEALYGLTKSDGQGILLLNRRGFAEHVSCRSCGFVYKCKHCNVSLTYHKQQSVLKCHYCGYAEFMKPVCPECGSKYIRAFGRGTQKLEDELEKYFPGITVLRMDADTTSAKGAHFRMLKEFGEGRYKLMVGTQMVAKGLDFENVVLVGLIAPDVTLNMPEYKSSERVFRLISQASGRAGRGSKKGNVIVQSYQPEHYAVTNAVENDYDGFWQREIEARRNGYYPPFSRVLRLLFTSAEPQSAKAEAENAADVIKKYMADHIDTDVLVSQAPIERLHDKYRWHVVVKYSTSNDDAHETLHSAVDEILDMNEFSVVRVAVDFAPVSLL